MVWIPGSITSLTPGGVGCRGSGGGGGCSGYLEGPQEVSEISTDSGFRVHLSCAPVVNERRANLFCRGENESM